MKLHRVPRFIMGGVKPPLSHAVIAGSNKFGTHSFDIRATALDKRKTANGKEVYKHCEGVFYFLNTIRFHGTRLKVISFTMEEKYDLLREFHELHSAFDSIL
jgi:transposase-like protein